MKKNTLAYWGFSRDGKPSIIAELGINHGGSLDRAKFLAARAIDAGAKWLKHQTHFPASEMSLEASSIVPSHCSESIFEVIAENSLSADDEIELKNFVQERGAIYFSTPFSLEAANFLNELNVPLFKIGSGELTNLPLLNEIAKLGKPVILSTGMADMSAVSEAWEIFSSRDVDCALLHCTNIYPTPPESIRLGGVTELRAAFPNAVIGFSDHSVGVVASIGAMALGASIIEKHFCESTHDAGPDIQGSMDPTMLIELLKASEFMASARYGVKGIYPEEEDTRNFAYASVVATRNLSAGETLSREDIWVKRPGSGILAKHYESLIGKRLTSDVQKNTQLPPGAFE